MKTVASMALPASTVFPSTSKFQIKHFQSQAFQLGNSLRLRVLYQTSPKCSVEASVPEFGGPNNMKTEIRILSEKLMEVIPDPVKEIPWKKAGEVLMERLLSTGQKAFKWILSILFIFGFVSDAIVSFSENQELMIPIGLFLGCLMTDFLKEISQELFPKSEEKALGLHFTGIGCFFFLLKLLSANLLVQPRMFLFHLANGGLMQLLWLWRSLPEGRDKSSQVAED